jgi:hypothetical protein
MHPRILLKSIPNMTNEISLEDFRLQTGIENIKIFKQLLKYLYQHNIGLVVERKGKKILSFSTIDRIKTSLLSIQLGCDIQECSNLLSWKDFEYFTSELLNLFEYDTKVNIILSKPRAQIDVIGIKKNFAITIDCKHWKYNNKTNLTTYAERQRKRSSYWLQQEKKITNVLPMVITLNFSSFKFINGVPIVPILGLKSFLNEFDKYEDFFTLLTKNNCEKN